MQMFAQEPFHPLGQEIEPGRLDLKDIRIFQPHPPFGVDEQFLTQGVGQSVPFCHPVLFGQIPIVPRQNSDEDQIRIVPEDLVLECEVIMRQVVPRNAAIDNLVTWTVPGVSV